MIQITRLQRPLDGPVITLVSNAQLIAEACKSADGMHFNLPS